jgi:dihydrofolate reductase
MKRLICDISMSLDGFITGPNPRREAPLGDGGERLHDWMTGLTDLRASHRTTTGTPDAQVVADAFDGLGALVMGRAMFDVGEEPWGDDPPFGMPVFVVTHRPRETDSRLGGTTYSFVTDGIESALEQARAAAGNRVGAADGDVGVAGGADIMRQYLRAGLLDELQIHLVPVLMGGGVRLFEDDRAQLECTRVVASEGITHLRYRPSTA